MTILPLHFTIHTDMRVPAIGHTAFSISIEVTAHRSLNDVRDAAGHRLVLWRKFLFLNRPQPDAEGNDHRENENERQLGGHLIVPLIHFAIAS